MKNIKLKIFTILALVLMQAPVFGQAFISSSPSPDPQTIIGAIKTLDTHIANVLSGSAANSIVSTLNAIFVGKADNSGNLVTQGELDKKIDLYAKKFYGFYTNQDFINSTLEITDDKGISDNASFDLVTIEKNVKDGTSNLLKQEIYYDTQKSLLDKVKDALSLLLVKAEGGKNNIGLDTPLSNVNPNITVSDYAASGTQYGSVNNTEIVTDNSSSDIKDILNADALLGPDGYFGDKADNARLFINQLMQAALPPKIFYFPSMMEKNVKNGVVKVYYPYKDTQKNTPYTESQEISTATPEHCGCTNCGCVPSPCSCDSDYDKMIKMVNKSQIYQEYKTKTRSKIALRTFYLNNIFRSFQERYKKNKTDQSLLEKEKNMALVGLTPTYYGNLKAKTVAEVNLETLHTLNKVVYFLYKLHRDNERSLLMVTILGAQNQAMDMEDEKNYLNPIGKLIDNACWDYPSGQAALSDRANGDKVSRSKRWDTNPPGVCINPNSNSN